MASVFPTEQNFLLNLIVSKFNTQFNTNWKLDDFVIYTIAPKATHKLGYELQTKIVSDFIRIRIYFNFDNHDEISDFSLALSPITGDSGAGNLSDEIYVAFGLIDSFYKDNNIYNFSYLDNPLDDVGFLIDHLGNYLIDHLGNQLIY